MRQLRGYQVKAIDDIATRYSQGYHKMIFQAATGSGKTVTFSGMVKRFIDATGKKVLISVHRDKLLTQARRSIYEWNGIIAEPVVAGMKYRNPNAQVYVTMVETAKNRLKKNPRWFGDIGLLIIDEAHLANHNPLHQYFTDEQTLIVGFTATPISSSKRDPLKNHYEDIVCAIDIPDLIAQGALCGNKTYHIKNGVKRDNLKIKNGEFDNAAMGFEFSKGKNVENCVKAYEDKAKGTKAIVFNCNVAHSKLVTDAFVAAGYDARHLDGTIGKVERAEILNWFENTPGAILNNIDILTTGADFPSIETVIMNRSTKSLPLWLQACGRGSRPNPGKPFFTILDLGGNALEHGDWSSRRDWAYLFHNPPKPGKGDGVAPVKECVNTECGCIITAQTFTCPFCGADQPRKEVEYDTKAVELELLSESVQVPKIVERVESHGYNPYAALHEAKALIVKQAKAQSHEMNETRAYNLLGIYQMKVQEWCKVMGKPYNEWHKRTTGEWFFEELKKQMGYELPELKLAI